MSPLLRGFLAFLVAALLGGTVTKSGAATVDLSWDQCLGVSGAPVVDRTATLPGTYTIALTGRQLIGRIAGTRFVFELRSPGGLPDAWRFDAAGCAAGAVQTVTGTTSKSCPAIGSLPSTSATMTLDPGGQAGTLTIDVLYNGSIDLQPSSSYSLGRILLDFTESCSGLDRPVCLSLVEATFLPAEGGGEEDFSPGQAFLTWNDAPGATICSARSLRGIVVEEFMTACSSFDLGTQFVELSPPPEGTVLPGELRMRIEDRSGATLSEAEVVTPSRVGEPWPAGGSWLLGTPQFETGSGLQTDLEVTPLLDPDGGRIVLYDSRPGGAVLQDLAYGPTATVPAPLRGESRVRTPQGTYEASTPAPRTFIGTTSGAIACVQAPPPPIPPSNAQFRISEIAYRCFDGHPSGRFVEVRSLNDSTWTGPLLLELLNAEGTVIAQRSGIFGAGNGTITPLRRSCLIASPTFSVPPDQPWDFFDFGDVQTFRLRSPLYGTVDEVRIGGTSPIAPPLDGLSLAFADDGSFAQGAPTATNSAGQTLGSTLCHPAPLGPLDGPCPLARVALNLPSSNALEFWTARASLDTTQNAIRIAYDRMQPRIHFQTTSYYNPLVTLDDEFTLRGELPGEEVEIIAMFHAVGSSAGGCLPVHGCSDASAGLSWGTPDTTGGVNLGSSFDRHVYVPLRVRIGEPFRFLWRLGFGTAGYSSIFADFQATLRFANLPAGTRIESCMGYFDDTPVAALPSIVSAAAEGGVVRLEWAGPVRNATTLTVERRTSGAEWSAVGSPRIARDRIAFEDHVVVAGQRYAYRLAWSDATGEARRSEETWVQVPGTVTSFAARLRNGIGRGGPFDLALALPHRDDVRLALYDLRGRRLADRTWTPERPGNHELSLAPDRVLAPGVYWIRVTQGAERATLRAIVLGR